MTCKGTFLCGVPCLALAMMLATGWHTLSGSQAPSGAAAPAFTVDPFWPKPLPNGWLMGTAIGVGVDDRDHVFIVHRPDTISALEAAAEANPPAAECCRRAPPVLEFDPAGNLVGSWGGPGEGYEWPGSNHGIFVDHKGNVWVGGNGPKDAHVLKFTKEGKFLAQFGRMGQNKGSHDTENFGRVAKIFVIRRRTRLTWPMVTATSAWR